MSFSKKFFVTILSLCLICATACTGSNQPSENQEIQSTATINMDVAPTLEIEQNQEMLPAGVLVGLDDDSSIKIYNSEGQVTAEINLPGIGSLDPEYLHMAGKINANVLSIPFVYHGWDPNQALMVSTQNDTQTIRESNSFLALAGAAGQSALAFSEVLIENNAPHSYLYAGNLDNLNTVTPFYDLIDEPTQMALSPVGIKAIDGNPQGVWYTKTGWGIGGADLVFPITRGLYYYDLNNGNNEEHIDPDRSFQGISPDYSMAGSVAFDFEGDRSMTVLDLENNQSINFPLKSSSDRGAGFVVFSPDNQYAAWLEASGSFMDSPASFQAVVRVGDLSNGNIGIEIEDNMISQNLSGSPVNFIKPVGWLDNQSLLIEMRGEDWGDVSLIRINLNDRTLAYFCEGNFAGFSYP